MRRLLIGLLLLSALASSFTEPTESRNYPQGYFRAPVKTEMRLSGTFGELRPNHFHSGIDIKGIVGQSIYAPAEGFIYRIKIQAGGYGKALYMRHPNGYSTVYAHLQKFSPEIEKYVKDAQYQKQSFAIDLYPTQGKFKFEQGEKIGTMGVTGGSFGPHLHFEIRNSRNEKPINPLLFGITAKDTQAPRMNRLKVYKLNKKLETKEAKTYELIRNGRNYRVAGDTLLIGAWRAGFGLNTYDQFDGAPNKNGIYSLAMYIDDSLFYDFEMESFAFSETRYLNAHLDYAEQVNNRSYYNRTYKLPGNYLSIYNKKQNDGILPLSKSKVRKVTLIASDVAGNQSKLEFWVRRAEVKSSGKHPVYNYVFPYDEANAIDNYSLYLHFPKGSFYENLYLKYQSVAEESSNVYSNVHQIHDRNTPVHKYFDIAIRPTSNIPDHLRDKTFVAHCDEEDRVTNMGGKWKDGRLYARSRKLGDYSIKVDNVPPVIQASIFKSNMRGYNKMSFLIRDNFGTGGNARGLRFKGTIDGKWVLMVYDAKNDLLTHRFEKDLPAGQHEFKLVVTDAVGNQSVFTQNFLR